MSRDISCQACYVIWADIGFRNAHVSVFPALAGSPPSRIYAEVLIRGVCKDSYDVRAAPCESFIVRTPTVRDGVKFIYIIPSCQPKVNNI